jgi:hypothetical protein
MVDIQPAKWPEESGSLYDNTPAYFTEPPTIAIIKSIMPIRIYVRAVYLMIFAVLSSLGFHSF